nr:hypothetical protein [Tanacetum cinerariifolium]
MLVVKNEKDEFIPQRTINGWRVCIDYHKLNNVTQKDHFPLSFIDQMLERLTGHEYYFFLDGFSGYFQIPIAPEDQKKTIFTCPYRTFAYKRMPFRLCKAPTTFQRCMTAIFHELIEDSMEIACPMTQLLVKDTLFNFFRECIQAFNKLKRELTQAPIMTKPDWSLPFEVMRDASDYAVGAVLGQRIDKHFKPIPYAIKMINKAQENYTTIEKELLAVVFAFDKFRQYMDLFHEERLMAISNKNNEPWYAAYANYLASRVLPFRSTHQEKQKFFSDLRHCFWDEPFLFKQCANRIIRRCVARVEAAQILRQCHNEPSGGHHGITTTARKETSPQGMTHLKNTSNTWMTFEGNTDLGSFREETDEITNLHKILEEVLLTERGDDVASIKRRRRDLFSDVVWNLETTLGRNFKDKILMLVVVDNGHGMGHVSSVDKIDYLRIYGSVLLIYRAYALFTDARILAGQPHLDRGSSHAFKVKKVTRSGFFPPLLFGFQQIRGKLFQLPVVASNGLAIYVSERMAKSENRLPQQPPQAHTSHGLMQASYEKFQAIMKMGTHWRKASL